MSIKVVRIQINSEWRCNSEYPKHALGNILITIDSRYQIEKVFSLSLVPFLDNWYYDVNHEEGRHLFYAYDAQKFTVDKNLAREILFRSYQGGGKLIELTFYPEPPE